MDICRHWSRCHSIYSISSRLCWDCLTHYSYRPIKRLGYRGTQWRNVGNFYTILFPLEMHFHFKYIVKNRPVVRKRSFSQVLSHLCSKLCVQKPESQDTKRTTACVQQELLNYLKQVSQRKLSRKQLGTGHPKRIEFTNALLKASIKVFPLFSHPREEHSSRPSQTSTKDHHRHHSRQTSFRTVTCRCIKLQWLTHSHQQELNLISLYKTYRLLYHTTASTLSVSARIQSAAITAATSHRCWCRKLPSLMHLMINQVILIRTWILCVILVKYVNYTSF